MEITTEIIKKLRDETGVSVMQCKKALEEAGGDLEKAKIILRKQSSTAASKKADRALGAGLASAYTHAGGQVVAAVVLACETDFVARNEEFAKLAYAIAMHVAAMDPVWITRNEVVDEDLAAARSVFEKEVQAVAEGNRAKALEGKIASFVKERTLLEQPFVKDPSVTVQTLIEQAVQKFGEKVEVVRMERLSVK
ncbi:MAG TPA: elongation factor Ts [Candidatus Paceibacterota bacterium]|nr:elongation factor Ts [Candidatus Paceibacterota bacterium]